jgi:hypothetical protein
LENKTWNYFFDNLISIILLDSSALAVEKSLTQDFMLTILVFEFDYDEVDEFQTYVFD